MTTPLQEEVAQRCKNLMNSNVFWKQLRNFVSKVNCRVTLMTSEQLGQLLNDLVIPWEKGEVKPVELCYRTTSEESYPFALCALKNGEPDLSSVVLKSETVNTTDKGS